jgi:hypothetical protein
MLLELSSLAKRLAQGENTMGTTHLVSPPGEMGDLTAFTQRMMGGDAIQVQLGVILD